MGPTRHAVYARNFPLKIQIPFLHRICCVRHRPVGRISGGGAGHLPLVSRLRGSHARIRAGPTNSRLRLFPLWNPRPSLFRSASNRPRPFFLGVPSDFYCKASRFHPLAATPPSVGNCRRPLQRRRSASCRTSTETPERFRPPKQTQRNTSKRTFYFDHAMRRPPAGLCFRS